MGSACWVVEWTQFSAACRPPNSLPTMFLSAAWSSGCFKLTAELHMPILATCWPLRSKALRGALQRSAEGERHGWLQLLHRQGKQISNSHSDSGGLCASMLEYHQAHFCRLEYEHPNLMSCRCTCAVLFCSCTAGSTAS